VHVSTSVTTYSNTLVAKTLINSNNPYVIQYFNFLNKYQRLTKVANTTSTADAMDILLNGARQVKVNNVFHVADIQSTSSNLVTAQTTKLLVYHDSAVQPLAASTDDRTDL